MLIVISACFQLLCRLLNYAPMSGYPLSSAETFLAMEITWLKDVRDTVKKTGECQVEDALLEGYLNLTKELLALVPPSIKYGIGSDEKRGLNMIKVRFSFCLP